MKKLTFIFALMLTIAASNNTVSAQRINVSINIDSQPAWGPTGYDYVRYYYIPEIDCYYDIDQALFIYSDRGRWISARYLPYAYHSYDLYGLYKVAINVDSPWRYHQRYYANYASYRGYGHRQVIIRDCRDDRYYRSRNNRVAWYDDNQRYRDDYKYRDDYRYRDNDRYRDDYRYRDNDRRSDNRYRNDDRYERQKRNYDNQRSDSRYKPDNRYSTESYNRPQNDRRVNSGRNSNNNRTERIYSEPSQRGNSNNRQQSRIAPENSGRQVPQQSKRPETNRRQSPLAGAMLTSR